MVFSRIDLRSGYHQLWTKGLMSLRPPLRRGWDITSLLFYCWTEKLPWGVYELMNRVFYEYLDKFIQVFIDDILIYSWEMEEHDEQLRLVLQCLQEHKLYGKLSKFSFYQSKIHYLGHVTFIEGIFVDPTRVEAIMNGLRQ
jgi:hypothetical protein